MFNNKKIAAINEKLKEISNDYEIIKTANQSIINFDEVYKKLLDNYNNNKALINEQMLQYDKKIIENSAVVDERLLSFQTKLDNILDNTIGTLRDELVTKSIENRKELISLEEKLKNDVNEYLFESAKTVSNNMQKYELETNEIMKQQLDKMSNDVNELLEHHKSIWNENHIKFINDINGKLNSYELNLDEMINRAISKQLNSLIVDDIVNKSTDLILHAFNKSLIELGESDKKSIIDAIKALLIPKLPRKIEKDEEKIKRKIEKKELFHANYKKLKLCVENGIIPMVVGPAGTGKSHAAEQIARDMNLDFYMANRIQNTFELVGFVNAAGEYVTTQFYEAYKKGGIFLFDEVDASSPEALVTINAAIAQKEMAFPGHPTNIKMHKDFKAICAGNTFGNGSTLQYTGRNKLDAATLDRFMIIEWDYDKVLEDKLVNDKELLKLCWALRDSCRNIDESIIVSTRGIITLEKIILANKRNNAFELKDLFNQKLFESISKDKKTKIKRIYLSIEDTCKNNSYLEYIKELTL